MEVLVTGGDTEIGRTIAEGFRDAGHNVVISGARREQHLVGSRQASRNDAGKHHLS